MRSDCHMHTNFSSDSETSPRDMVEGAIAKGLDMICFTDHEDKDYPPKCGVFSFDKEAYFKTMLALQEEYRGRIEIRIGVEIGLQPHLNAYYKEYVNTHPFDFVIGSLHLVHGADPYYGGLFENRSDSDAYREAFEAMLECVRTVEDFDVLGHIDYVVRYGKHQAKEYSYQTFAPYIDEILKELICRGKGIELNTAGFKYGLGFCHPHPDVIRRYRELGGEIITIGADGHKPEHIAYDFAVVNDILRQCGFKYYTEFKERKPIFQQLL